MCTIKKLCALIFFWGVIMNIAKRKYIAVILCVMVCLFTSCTQAETQSSVTSIALSDGATQGENTSDGANALALLPEGAQAMFPAEFPSFLTSDLQQLYRAAYYLAYHHEIASGFNVDGASGAVTINGAEMYKDLGFATYEDYEKALYSVFDVGYVNSRAETWGTAYAKGDDGALYTSQGARGANIEYVDTSFEPVSEKETEINFVIVGHYDSSATDENEDAPAAMYETDYRAILVKTDSGWRFVQFSLTF